MIIQEKCEKTRNEFKKIAEAVCLRGIVLFITCSFDIQLLNSLAVGAAVVKFYGEKNINNLILACIIMDDKRVENI
ncbi:MAG: hypothetical protein IKH65_08340 [Clostridia bacterium]|nr:hypothetical protein [Clostridia bacterium]